MNKIIPLTINDKNIIIQKEWKRYIPEREIKEVIKDIIENNLEIPLGKSIDLSFICDSMFFIVYKGIITTIENINNVNVSVNNMIYEVC